MALDAEQRRILSRIKQIGARMGATPKEIKAAIETGLVESNLRNLKGGDRDSAGWRQERASLYADPTNLDASIKRFFQETRAVRGKYGRAGDLAAAVQRPAAQYRGRYQDNSARAQSLLGAPARGGTGGMPLQSTRTVTTGPPVTPEGFTRDQLLKQYLLQRGKPGSLLGLSGGLGSLQEQTKTITTRGQPQPTSSTAGVAGGRSPLLELFWQGEGGINIDNGKRVPQGFVSGHKDHVHVAAGPKTAVKLGELAQRMGLRVSENPHFDPVDPVHTKGSYHYRNMAIDVSGDPKRMRQFAQRVARMYGVRG